MSDQFILDDGNQFILFDADLGSAQSVFSAPELNTFVKVTITMKAISDGSTTDISFCNREVLPELDMWPLLKRVDNLGSRNGEYLPELSRLSFSLINTPHSFGVERKFSDLLDRYTLIECPVKVYIAQIALGDESLADGDFDEVWRSVITDLSMGEDDIRISMTRALIPNRLATKIVDRYSFPDAPEESLGKGIPLIFSEEDEFIEIQPIRTSEFYDYGSGADTENRVDYVYATTFSDEFLPSGTGADGVKVYAENQDREWQELTFVADPIEPLLEFPLVVASFLNSWGTVKEYGYKLLSGENVDGGEIIIGVNWFLFSTTYTLTPPTGDYSYTLKVYNSQDGFPGTVIASSTLESGDSRIVYHDTLGGESVYKFEFRLSKPVIIPLLDNDPGSSAIFITMSRNDTGDKFSLCQEGTAPASLPDFEKYIITDATSGSDQNFYRYVVSQARDHFEVYAVSKTDDLSGGDADHYQNGLGHVSFTLGMRDQDNLPDITKIRLLAKSQGMRDDSSGTITATPSLRLEHPLHQVRLLLMEWDGAAWNENVFDYTKFDDTHLGAFYSGSRWGIKTAGATQGRVRTSDVINEICRAGNSRLVSFVSGTSQVLGLYVHGIHIDSSFIIDDERAVLKGFEILGTETILNKVQILYNRSIQTRVESLLAEGGSGNYTAIVDSDFDSLDVPYDLVARSKARWGELPLEDINYNFITKEQTAKSVAAYLLRRWNSPQILIQVEVPYSYYADLEAMNTGIIKMVNLPDYYGTTHEAMPVTEDGGTDTVDLLRGHYFKRYKSYRVQVESNDIVFSETVAIKRVLTLRVITDKDIA
jgi:hypothetical protein